MIVIGLLLALVQKADRPVLYDAARERRAADVKRIVSAGADTEAKNKYEMTALHWAAGEGHTAIVNDSRGIMDLSTPEVRGAKCDQDLERSHCA